MNHCHETVDGLSATTLAALLAAEMERSERAHPSPRPAYTRGAEAARTLEREAGRPKATLRQSRGTGFDPGSYCL